MRIDVHRAEVPALASDRCSDHHGTVRRDRDPDVRIPSVPCDKLDAWDGDELPLLMKKWRKEIGTHAPPDPKGAGVLDNAQAALANLVTFLAQWRNKYGSGHGRAEYPPGLAARHARLAVDAAETCIRFIVTTMDDLQLLPP